jgi:hypothetical protein
MHVENELSQLPQFREVNEHLTELATLSGCEMIRACDQQMATLPDVVGLFFRTLSGLDAFLCLAGPPASSLASTCFGMLTP